jgi:nitrate/nitrite transporter NarK
VAFRDIIRRENFWYIGLAFLCLHGANLALTINLAPLVQSLGYTLGDAAALLSGLSIAALVGKILCGVIADRFGSRPPLVVVGLMTALSLGSLSLTHSLPLLWLAFITLGLTQGVWTLVAAATAAEFGAESFGQAYGLVVMFASVGSVAPPIFARLNEMAGHYVPGLLLFTAVAVAGTLAALLLNQRGVPAVNLAAGAGELRPG